MTTGFAPSVYVVDAAGAAASDTAAIAAGIPSRALMQRAGAAAAAEIARQFRQELPGGVVIATGPGNNGGDGWVVAAALHAVGIRVRVVECEPARTPDALAERDAALAAGVAATAVVSDLAVGGERIAVDALLGTGFRAGTPLRGKIADAVAELLFIADRGGAVVALDVPTGLDATTGEHEAAPSRVTCSRRRTGSSRTCRPSPPTPTRERARRSRCSAVRAEWPAQPCSPRAVRCAVARGW